MFPSAGKLGIPDSRTGTASATCWFRVLDGEAPERGVGRHPGSRRRVLKRRDLAVVAHRLAPVLERLVHLGEREVRRRVVGVHGDRHGQVALGLRGVAEGVVREAPDPVGRRQLVVQAERGGRRVHRRLIVLAGVVDVGEAGVGAGGARVEFDRTLEGSLRLVEVAGGGGGLAEGRVGHRAVGFDLEGAPGHAGSLLELSLPGHAGSDRHEGARRRVRIQFDHLLPGLDDLEVVLEHPVGVRHRGPGFEDLLFVLDVLERPAVDVLCLRRGIRHQRLLEGAGDVLPLLEVQVDAAEPQADIPAVRMVLEYPEEETARLAEGGLRGFRVFIAERTLGIIEMILGDVDGAGHLPAVERRLILREGARDAHHGGQAQYRHGEEPTPKTG